MVPMPRNTTHKAAANDELPLVRCLLHRRGLTSDLPGAQGIEVRLAARTHLRVCIEQPVRPHSGQSNGHRRATPLAGRACSPRRGKARGIGIGIGIGEDDQGALHAASHHDQNLCQGGRRLLLLGKARASFSSCRPTGTPEPPSSLEIAHLPESSYSNNTS